jgi:hypothetical protein
MPENEMPIEPRIGPQRAFQVDQGARLCEFEVCSSQRFIEHVKAENAATGSDDGQARAVYRQAVAKAKGSTDSRRTNAQFR